VLLALYERYGEDCVNRLNGQWAFAIWDARTNRLFLSRDRMGVRPLFYTSIGATLLFASEIKALFADPRVRRALDPEGLDQVFTFWAPLAPRTCFQGVSELPPGHSMTVSRGGVVIRRYWQPDYAASTSMKEPEAAERLRELLVDATRIRLRSDVPVGAYLSGGIDSSVVTALAAGLAPGRLDTFSVAFDDPEFDESAYQHEVVHSLATSHRAVRCTGADIARVFPDVVWHAEKPLLRTAPAPFFVLSRLVRDAGYKVVLTGEGADEILAGYDIFKEAKIRRFWSVFPDSRIRPALLRRLYPYMASIQTQPDSYLQAFFRVTPEEAGDPVFSHLPRWRLASQAKRLYSPDLRNLLASFDPVAELRASLPARYGSWDPLARAQYLETAHLLPGYILSSQGDRMAMGNSVEARFPFLDHRIVEFVGSLPPRFKLRVLDEKHILKRAVRDLIPASVLRRKKQPYRAPDAKSFFPKTGPTRDYVDELLSPRRLKEAGLFDSVAVGTLVAKARAARMLGAKDNMGLVGVLSTQLLIERFTRTLDYADDPARDTRVHHRELPVRAG
jgi:asparagine synthase (glutamine-hydrolysing)